MKNTFLMGCMALSCTLAATGGWSKPLGRVTHEERAKYIRKAQVWMPTDISHLDILKGPTDVPGYYLGETVSCDFKKKKPGGTTNKFYCKSSVGKKLKIRYDAANGKVYSMPVATRLFWALGFGSVRSFAVRVDCHDCPREPFEHWDDPDVADRIFDPATVERKFPGVAIHEKGKKKQGWSWDELDDVSESEGGATKAQIDALKLLAAFVQHGDNNATQQKLVCLPDGVVDDGDGHSTCKKPFMYVADLGSTFGGAERLDERASMSLASWERHSIWKDRGACIADLAHTPEGTLTDPRISEEGRKFLSSLLEQLSDQQILNLFRAGRADERDQGENGLTQRSRNLAPLSDWVRVFKQKRDEIRTTSCTGSSLTS